MQTFTSATCANELTPANYNSSTGTMTVSSNSFIALEDTRDGNTYAVARLNDGNCWMVENLRLADSTLTVNDTHNPALPLTNVYNADPSLATTSNHLSATSNNWCYNNAASCNDKSLLNTTTTTNTESLMTSPFSSDNYAANIYSYGNYYNWYSATAGNGKRDTVSGVSIADNTNNQNLSTTGDICPSNWRLPMGGAFPNTNMRNSDGVYGTETRDDRATNDFYKLIYGMLAQNPNSVGTSNPAYTYYKDVTVANDYQPESNIGTAVSNLIRMYPNNFGNAGYWYQGQYVERGTGGDYWTSTDYNPTPGYAYYMIYNKTQLMPGTDFNTKNFGFTVRCLAGI